MTALGELGSHLRTAGLVPRALAAWATPRLSALPHLLPTVPRAETPASALLELFVAGREVAVDRVRRLELAALHEHALIETAGNAVHACVAILPLGDSLLVCDRLDAPREPELVCWPDDSSYHLALALPRTRCASWIDLGCGSAFAPLLRPQLAESIVGSDLNPRAVRHAQLGAELSGLGHLSVSHGDLGGTLPPRARHAQLVTCNAPIPDAGADPFRPLWRASDGDFVARLYAAAQAMALPGGTVVVHAALDALAPVVGELPGERVIVSYTPPGVQAFGVAWWRPDGKTRHVATHRDLVPQAPHLTYADYEAVIAP